MENINLIEVRKTLPHGAMQEIAKRVRLSRGTITMVFNGKTKSPKINEILKATAEYLAEYKAKQNEVKELLNNVLV
jgi:AcrR family transcriptional regulator